MCGTFERFRISGKWFTHTHIVRRAFPIAFVSPSLSNGECGISYFSVIVVIFGVLRGVIKLRLRLLLQLQLRLRLRLQLQLRLWLFHTS